MGIEFDLFESPIPQIVKCNLCSKVIEDPVKIELNGGECHVCKNCCIDRFEEQNDCQYEFGEIKWDSADEEVISALQALTIKCPNITYGCRATFPMDSLSTHIQHCAWRPFKCRWNCNTVLALKKLRLHEECCEFKFENNQFLQTTNIEGKQENVCEEKAKFIDENEATEEDEINCAGDDKIKNRDFVDEGTNNEILVEADVHRNESCTGAQSMPVRQRFGALYRKVNDLEKSFIAFSQQIEEINEKQKLDVKKLYDYSYDLMQTLKSQTQQDLFEIKQQLSKSQRENRRGLIARRCCIS
ncbi:E3 ubiquitin-protein ligase PDZRN3-like protein [Dinothrombium tinctorium]|uniref:E3 ubiquitin-protein ligase PDZRN3-like protein n=1 Tax=Dinothrombium tinctorium TaxID=1965070 RepID=A0A3S3NP19_9ACAR|nr:E3 ubiquitin-protein ligase PDZRN3-like protein [Dinothrombium tinctorium]RWS07917.1 E3 ubiquitin-protein ligase PDZRN3-like protein [Dinothrombium tinctorium]